MNTIIYLSKLLFSLFVGVLIGRKTPKAILEGSNKLLTVTLYTLLFFMGLNTGSIENILNQLKTIGSSSLIISLFSIFGTVFVSIIASYFFDYNKVNIITKEGYIKKGNASLLSSDINKMYNAELSKEAKIQKKRHWFVRFIYIIREPFILVLTVFFGILCKLFTPYFEWYTPSIITYLLYFLLFFSGLNIINSNIKFKEIFNSPYLLLLPLWTVLGTYLGALILSILTSFSLKETLALSSGFGWYSLSGIMITDLGYPILGSISFLANIFRESFTFFLIPFFAKFGRRFFYSSICIGGATTMDVTLPMITTNYGASSMIPAMYHGLVITLLVPFLIPLFF